MFRGDVRGEVGVEAGNDTNIFELLSREYKKGEKEKQQIEQPNTERHNSDNALSGEVNGKRTYDLPQQRGSRPRDGDQQHPTKSRFSLVYRRCH